MAKYTSILPSKNGYLIPYCENHSLHSRYDPIHEANLFAEQFSGSPLFILVYGIAGGYHINSLLLRFPKAHILAVELDEDSLSFISKIPLIQQLLLDKRITFTTVKNEKNELLRLYIPVLYGSLTIAEFRPWCSLFSDAFISLKKDTSEALATVAADFSVQSHFGKIWQRNIFLNLAYFSHYTKNYSTIVFPVNKIAAIVAAGPSLDESVIQLKNERNNYYIIAVDTAFGALIKHSIQPDAVISVDGQAVSHCHYMHSLSPTTLFVFDLCSNPQAVRRAAKNKTPILFTETGHPLSIYASCINKENNSAPFLHLSAGSGTVTVGAASFAHAVGFSTIAFFGADFCYNHGKSYTKGTYLDTLYNSTAYRLNTSESMFDHLMYRTPLTPQNNGMEFTNSVLSSFKKTLNDYLISCDFYKKNNTTFIKKNSAQSASIVFSPYNFKLFCEKYKKELRLHSNTHFINFKSPIIITLFPFAAFLKRCSDKEGINIQQLLKLAYTKTLRYTENL